MSGMQLTDIEIVDDRTAGSTCAEGFLRLARLTVRNRYADGSASAPYHCDIVSRRCTDAVALCLYEISGGAKRSVKVLLKEAPRAPIYLRKLKPLVVEDAHPYLTIIELVAGLIELEDKGPDAIAARAVEEAREEAGVTVAAGDVAQLGGPTFASPGVSDEKIFFTVVECAKLKAGIPEGDGGVMEEATRPLILDLREAIAMCRDGRIPDMKTETGLLRLADRIGYLPQLDCFVDELPPDWRGRFHAPGLSTA